MESGHWFEEDHWPETLGDGEVVHGLLFELEASVQLAV